MEKLFDSVNIFSLFSLKRKIFPSKAVGRFYQATANRHMGLAVSINRSKYSSFIIYSFRKLSISTSIMSDLVSDVRPFSIQKHLDLLFYEQYLSLSLSLSFSLTSLRHSEEQHQK